MVETGREGQGRLVIRHFDAATNQSKDYNCSLPSAPRGTPGAWADHLVFPCGDGVLVRKDIPGGDPMPGLNWRAERADPDAQGHVLPLDADNFLVTDGSRRLFRMSWPKGGDCTKKAEAALEARILSAPVIRLGEAGKFRVYAADADNQVNLLNEDLSPERGIRQALNGPITAGPFDVGHGIACVVDGRQLVLLDAENLRPLWTHQARAEIVGRPVILEGRIILADAEGHFVGLNPATGKAQGKGYRIRANAAPACTPVPLGPDRLFAPLTDGTVILLAARRF
jgi:hypothetical protein